MGKGSKKPKIDERQVQLAQDAKFKPYTLTTTVGTTDWDKSSNQFNVELAEPLSSIQREGYYGSQPLMSQIPEAYGREAAQFSFDRDLAGRTSDIFREQSSLLEPAFAQQRQQLQSNLFGSGRMGLMLAGEAAGAGAGGMVSPDAFGLGRAQSETLANLAAQSRQQALTEQQQAYNIDSGMFGINETLEQQRAENLLTGATTMFGFGEAVSDREVELMKLGLTAEQARGTASAQASGAMTGAQNAANQAQSIANQPSFLEQLTIGMVSGGAEGAGAAAAAAMIPPSDIRLKENIVKLGKYASGLNMYTWDWNEDGKKVAHPDQPTVGVMAQEAMLVFPEAVMKGDDGYLRVDYGRIS